MRKYSFSQRVINEWNKLPNDCVNTSSVNMFKNRIDRYLIHIDEKIVGLSISQWLPCPLAIWNLLFGMAVCEDVDCRGLNPFWFGRKIFSSSANSVKQESIVDLCSSLC